LTAHGGANIVDYELAGSATKAQAILDGWDASARDASWLLNLLDYLWMVSYGALGFLSARYLADRADERGWGRTARASRVLAIAAIAAACFDAVENVGLLVQLRDGRGSDIAVVSGVAATIKFALLFGLVVPGSAVVRVVLWARRPAGS
jgi:hypothetical protein